MLTTAGTPLSWPTPKDLHFAVHLWLHLERAGPSEEFKRLLPALRELRAFDPIISEVVKEVCFKAPVVLTPGRGLKHSQVAVDRMAAKYARDSDRTVRDWVGKAWDWLFVALGHTEEARILRERGLIWAKALDAAP